MAMHSLGIQVNGQAKRQKKPTPPMKERSAKINRNINTFAKYYKFRKTTS
jgi:hypothetical protein